MTAIRILYTLLPFLQAEFGLGYAAVGFLRAVYSGVMAAFQVPASALENRFGEPLLLALGTAIAGCGYLLAGASLGLPLIIAGLVIRGIVSSAQHPIGSDLVASAFPGAVPTASSSDCLRGPRPHVARPLSSPSSKCGMIRKLV